MDKTIEIFERVLKELKSEEELKHTATGTMTAQRLHGLGGLFNAQGTDPLVFSTYVKPQSIWPMLPAYPSIDEDPTFETLTGFTTPDGTQPTESCDDAPTGFQKGCRLTARFGKKRFDTQEIEMDKVMLRLNRGDYRDLRLLGTVLDDIGPGGITQDDALNIITKIVLLKVAATTENALAIDTWQGTVAAGTFPGLSAQIATGQVDADLNAACPSLDSDIKDFNYNNVCGTTLDIVEYLSSMMYYLENLASSTGLAPVDFKLAMRPQLWFELSACWPCSYLTNRCTTAQVGYNAAVINDNTNVAMRDDMRQRMMIPINGKWYQVIEDTGIFEHNNINNGNVPAGSYASTINVLPFSVLGNTPTLYREFVNYGAAAPDEALLSGANNWFHTDNGSYSWSYLEKRWCYSLSLKTEPRIILRTPHLAGSIQNVMYSPLQHLREADFDSPYHVDGGVSLRTPGTRYAVWAGQGGVR